MRFLISKNYLQLFSLVLFAFNVMAAETKDTLVLTQQLISPQIQGNSTLAIKAPGANAITISVNSSPVMVFNGDGTVTLSNLTATTVPYLDASKHLVSSAATPTQLGFLANATSNLCGINQSCTEINKTFTSPAITTPTGIVKGDVGLGNVDNTSDVTKNAASVTLTNKSISGSGNTLTNIPLSAFTNLGTTSTVLHGNGAGNPTFAAVALGSDVTGTLAIANAGTNNPSLGVTAGSMFYADGSKIVSMGAGSTGQVPISNGTSAPTWGTPLGGLVGDRELNPNPTVDVAITGYTAYADAAGVQPVDGTGGSPNTTCTYSTSSPITGAGQLLITKAGSANRQGEGCAILTNTLSTADKLPTVEQIDFDYQIASGTFTAGSDGPSGVASDYEVFLYDTTNAVVIQPLVFKLYSNSKGHFTSWFQTATNATTYRLIFHNATTTTNNFTIGVDNISFHPAKNGAGAGQIIASRAHVSSGASTTAGNAVNFDTIDFDYTNSISTGVTTWKYTVPAPGVYMTCVNYYFGVGAVNGGVYKNGSLYAGIQNSDSDPGAGCTSIKAVAGDTIMFSPVNATGTPSALTGVSTALGNYIDIFMVNGASGSSIPPVVAASAHVGSAASTNAGIPFNFDTVDFDTTGSITTGVGTWKFTAPYPGTYHVEAMLNVGGADDILVYKNGAKYRLLSTAGASFVGTGATEVQMNAGDTIFISPGTNASIPGAGGTTTLAQTNHVSIFLIPPGAGSSPAGTVSSGSGSPFRIESATISITGVVTEVGSSDWINGNCALSASIFTCTFNSGIWASAPGCVVSVIQSGNAVAAKLTAVPTTTSFLAQTFLTATAAASDQAFSVICIAPR